MREANPGEEQRDYTYSVVKYDPPRSRWETVNIGIVLADAGTGIVHRRLLTAGESMQRSAEALVPCPAINALDPDECGTGGERGGGDPADRLRALHAKYGARNADILRVTEPRHLWLSRNHEGAAAWCYETMVSHDRGRGGLDRDAGGAGAAADPHDGKYTFVAVQYVPDAIRDEPVNVGVIVADSASGRSIARYATGSDLERLGTERFSGLDFALSYERETRVDDPAAFLRDIAEPDISCLHCTPPRKASGPSPKLVLDTLYDRIVAPAPHHDGARRGGPDAGHSRARRAGGR